MNNIGIKSDILVTFVISDVCMMLVLMQ